MATMLRYVVLHHTGIDNPHYDLMFETAEGSLLATWRSSDWPMRVDTILSPIAEHRRAYLEYEGDVSNNRGTVKRIATGTHEIIENNADQFIVLINNGMKLILPRR